MSVTKHQIFKIKITDNEKFSLDNSVEKTLNIFLSNPNHIYLNHSIAIATQDIEHYANLKTEANFLILSLVYKDINSTNLDVKTSSNKIKSIVHKQIETDSSTKEPVSSTEFDKELHKLNNTEINSENRTINTLTT